MAVQHAAARADGQSREEAHPNDFYETPAAFIAGQIFLSGEAMREYGTESKRALGHHIMDPCIGSGAYGYQLRNSFGDDALIHGMDIQQMSFLNGWNPYDIVGYQDYLTWQGKFDDFYDFAIFNPPYSSGPGKPLAHKFIQKALDEVRPGGVVSALVKAEFWNGKERLNALFGAGLRPVWIVPSVSRIAFGGYTSVSTQDYSIGIWVKGVDKRPEVRWMEWKNGIEIHG